MEIVLPITSRKRAHLNAHLTELEADLIRVRTELRKADKRHRYRRAALLGNKRRRQLVVPTLVRQFMPHMALPLSIAKLILPSVVWKDCRDDGVTVQAAHLEIMLDRQLIKDSVQKIKMLQVRRHMSKSSPNQKDWPRNTKCSAMCCLRTVKASLQN